METVFCNRCKNHIGIDEIECPVCMKPVDNDTFIPYTKDQIIQDFIKKYDFWEIALREASKKLDLDESDPNVQLAFQMVKEKLERRRRIALEDDKK